MVYPNLATYLKKNLPVNNAEKEEFMKGLNGRRVIVKNEGNEIYVEGIFHHNKEDPNNYDIAYSAGGRIQKIPFPIDKLEFILVKAELSRKLQHK